MAVLTTVTNKATPANLAQVSGEAALWNHNRPSHHITSVDCDEHGICQTLAEPHSRAKSRHISFTPGAKPVTTQRAAAEVSRREKSTQESLASVYALVTTM